MDSQTVVNLVGGAITKRLSSSLGGAIKQVVRGADGKIIGVQ